MDHRSEVAHVLSQIAAEYESAMQGIVGLAQVARHPFIATKMASLGKLQETLELLVEDHDVAMAMIITAIDDTPGEASA